MATIQYTTYCFNKPSLISEEQYIVIKHKLETDLKFYPFPRDGFYHKFKTVILIYIIGVPAAFILAETGVDFLNVIAGIFALFAIGGLFSLVPEWISYASYLHDRKIYFKALLKKIKISKDYNDFVSLI